MKWQKSMLEITKALIVHYAALSAIVQGQAYFPSFANVNIMIAKA